MGNLVSEEAKGGEDKASSGQGVPVAHTAQTTENGRRTPSASPVAASRGDVLQPRGEQIPVSAAVLTQRELSPALSVGSSSLDDDLDAVRGTARPDQNSWKSTKNYQHTPYDKKSCKDTWVGSKMSAGRAAWKDRLGSRGRPVRLVGRPKVLLVAAMFLKNAYRNWIHGDDGS